MDVIALKNVTKTYNPGSVPVHAVRDVSLSVSEGEFVAFVGPSGSGKTTLLNLIGGIDTPTQGQVVVDGTRIDGLAARQRERFRLSSIGFIFQDYSLLPVLTAEENVDLILRLQKRPRPERRRIVEETLVSVGLADRRRCRPPTLSGGQQQRVAVARALAGKPRFVLADEPTANLDGANADKLMDLMLGLNAGAGMTFLFSTHDPRVISKARRVVTLIDGVVAEDRRA